MLIKDIKLKNFMSIDDLYVDFSSVVYTIITGENASGKSSLLEAISMALVERRKGDSYRDYVQTGKKKATIDMNAILEGQDMRIVIEINTNKYGTPVTRTIYMGKEIFKNSDCTKLLKTFNVKYLQHITFYHQKDSSVLDLKPAEVSSLLKELFEINYSEQANVLSNSIILSEETSASLQTKLTTLEGFSNSFKETELLPDPTKNIKNISKAISEKEEAISNYDDILNQVDEISNLKKELTNTNDEIINLNYNKKGHLDFKASDEIRIQEVLKEIEEANKIGESRLNNTQVLKLDEERKDLASKIQTNRYMIPEWKSKIASKEKELKAYEEGVCPVCKHDLSTESSKIDEINKTNVGYISELEHIEENIKKWSKQHNILEKNYVEEKRKYDKISDKVTKANFALPNLNREQLNLKSSIKVREGYVRDIDNKLDILATKKHEYSEKLKGIRSADDKIKIVADLNNELSLLKKELANLERDKVINEERITNNKLVAKKMIEHLKEIDEVKSNINKINKKLASDKDALNILSNDFPNYVILQKTAQLEDSINDIIQKIFPGMVVKLILKRSGISFYYSPTGDEKYLPTNMASGLQSSILMLAWRVALAEMYGMDTLILDEVDASANDENSSLIYEFIASLNTFDQILIISHRKSAIKTIKDINDSIQSFWVDHGEYLNDSPELNV